MVMTKAPAPVAAPARALPVAGPKLVLKESRSNRAPSKHVATHPEEEEEVDEDEEEEQEEEEKKKEEEDEVDVIVLIDDVPPPPPRSAPTTPAKAPPAPSSSTPGVKRPASPASNEASAPAAKRARSNTASVASTSVVRQHVTELAQVANVAPVVAFHALFVCSGSVAAARAYLLSVTASAEGTDSSSSSERPWSAADDVEIKRGKFDLRAKGHTADQSRARLRWLQA